MRRDERAITQIEEILSIMDRCDVATLSFSGEEGPYGVPVNFGWAVEDGQVVLYFHGAKEGRKMEAVRKTGRAAFSMYASHSLKLSGEGEPACRSTMIYDSVCGCGTIRILEDREEKVRGLKAIMGQYSGEEYVSFPDQAVDNVAVLRLRAESITGKSNKNG